MNSPIRPGRSGGQHGSLAVELALILVFFLMPLIVGIIDFGQVLHAQIIITRAARQGVLAASRSQDVATVVNNYIEQAGYSKDDAQVAVTGSGLSGDPVTVTVSYDTQGMTILPLGSVSSGLATLAATATAEQY